MRPDEEGDDARTGELKEKDTLLEYRTRRRRIWSRIETRRIRSKNRTELTGYVTLLGDQTKKNTTQEQENES